jgi:hypothetical protein
VSLPISPGPARKYGVSLDVVMALTSNLCQRQGWAAFRQGG